MSNAKREKVRQHIDRKLRLRLRIYFIISVLLIGVVLYEVLANIVSVPFSLIGVGIGLVLGMVTARMYHLSWDHDAKQIVSRLDMFGGIILILYILFAIFRGRIIGEFIHGPAVGGVSIAIVTGIMIGRVVGTRGKILKILNEQKVFE